MNTKPYSISKILKEILGTDERLPFTTQTKTFAKGTVLFKPGDRFENNYFIIFGLFNLAPIKKISKNGFWSFFILKSFLAYTLLLRRVSFLLHHLYYRMYP